MRLASRVDIPVVVIMLEGTIISLPSMVDRLRMEGLTDVSSSRLRLVPCL